MGQVLEHWKSHGMILEFLGQQLRTFSKSMTSLATSTVKKIKYLGEDSQLEVASSGLQWLRVLALSKMAQSFIGKHVR